MDGKAIRTVLIHAGYKAGENRKLTITALHGIIRMTPNGMILEVGRCGIFYNETLSFEFLQGHLGALGKDENVPVLVTHCDGGRRKGVA
jgi:hypothetical protein